MVMHCINCGFELPADARFCLRCGHAVTYTQQNPATPSPPVPPSIPAAQSGLVTCSKCGTIIRRTAQRCFKCGLENAEYLEPPPSPISSTKWRMSPGTIGCLSIAGFFALVGIVVELSSNSISTSANSNATSTNASQPTDEPTPEPTPDQHAARQALQTYWMGATKNTALAMAYVQAAIDFAQEGDTVSASTALDKASSAADQAGTDSATDVPDGWDDVEGSLGLGNDALKRAVTASRGALDSDAPSAWSDASQANQEVHQTSMMLRQKLVHTTWTWVARQAMLRTRVIWLKRFTTL